MTDQKTIREAAEALSQVKETLTAFVGLDGFIDEIVHMVDQRQDFQHYTRIKTIEAYAKRLAAAAGKSTNIEMVTQQVKMGGNGPLMADALGRLGMRIHYVGAIGFPTPNPVFDSLRRHGPTQSISDPGITIATEFTDGKILNGRLEALAEITYQNLVDRIGGLDALDALLQECDFAAQVNWTMIPNLTGVWKGIGERIKKTGKGPEYFFFDLCDPEKRPREDLREVLEVIASYRDGKTTPILGLNEKESAEVCEALGLEFGTDDHKGMIERARRIADALGIEEILIHPVRKAVAISKRGEGAVDGPYCPDPKLTTGAGDHFNGGYCFGLLHGLSITHALIIGKATSGFYVRECRGPSREEIVRFCDRWADDSLDPWTGP